MIRLILSTIAFLFIVNAYAENKAEINNYAENVVKLSNGITGIKFDLSDGNYSVLNEIRNEEVLTNIHAEVDMISFHKRGHLKDVELSWNSKDTVDVLGHGKYLEVWAKRDGVPDVMIRFIIYDNKPFIVFQNGIYNNQSHAVRIKNLVPLSDGDLAFSDISEAKNLNGGAGAAPTKVNEGIKCNALNSILITYKRNDRIESITMGGLTYRDFIKSASVSEMQPVYDYKWYNRLYKKEGENFYMWAHDPYGRRVAPNEKYIPEDKFYIDVITEDPFESSEKYALAMREANNVALNPYSFPTVCGWAVSNKDLGLGVEINHSPGLVEEMDKAVESGITKFTPVAIRLEPDIYCYQDKGNTEQGWYDDKHWAKYRTLREPYETFGKWCKALDERGGIPFTYFQVGMPSNDFALAHPEWMINGNVERVHAWHPHHRPEVMFDFTHPGFKKYMLERWTALRKAGMKGIKFDYPETNWIPTGGFYDSTATTTSAYIEPYKLCREGLGKDARLHERILGRNRGEPTTDATVGIVDLQRVWTDASSFTPKMVSRIGLRWYKSRRVMQYYPDCKTLVNVKTKKPFPGDFRRSILTMLYVVSGRIELATSFRQFTPEMIYELSRIYPVHETSETARPIDAFSGKQFPEIYDFKVNEDWHQVTIYNGTKDDKFYDVPLTGSAFDASLKLQEGTKWYVYDFWNDSFVGKISSSESLKQKLRPEESRMLAFHKVENNPQVIATDRHLMQGYLDLKDVEWQRKEKVLKGTSLLLGENEVALIIASNGKKIKKVETNNGRSEVDSLGDGLYKITLKANKEDKITWNIKF